MNRNRLERTESKKWRGSWRRILSATIYNISCFTHGCSTGWVSGVLGADALIGGSWLAALPCLIALPAAPFFTLLADAKGRKAGAACVAACFILSWSSISWCGYRGVWAGRLAAGVGGAGALALSPLYCAELPPNAKGLAALPALACSLGILSSYVLGGLLSPHAMSVSMLLPPLVLLLLLLWIPETPSYLINVGRIQDAAKVMCWFNGSDFQEDLTDVIEQQEVSIRTSEGGQRGLMRQDSEAFQPMLKRCSGLESASSEMRSKPSVCWELFHHHRSRCALLSFCIILAVSASTGAAAITSYATGIITDTTLASQRTSHSLNVTGFNFTVYNGTLPKPILRSSEGGSMICGTALVLGAAVATVTVDKFGRKVLLISSCSGIACCLAVLGAYCDPRIRMPSWYHQTRNTTQLLHKLNHQSAKSVDFSQFTKENDFLLNIQNYSRNNDILDMDKRNDNFTGAQTIENMENDARENSNGTLKYIKDDNPAKLKKLESVTGILSLPVILLSAVLFFFNVGLGSIPYVLIMELFTINIRGLASSLLISWMWLTNFIVLRYYNTIAILLGLSTTYYISASVSLIGSGYIWLCLPETLGKSQKQIDDKMSTKCFGRFRRRHHDINEEIN